MSKCQFFITCINPRQNILLGLEYVYRDPALDYVISLNYYTLTKHLYTSCN